MDKRRRLFAMLVVLMLLCCTLTDVVIAQLPPISKEKVTASEIHEQAWHSMLDKAESDRYYKYAIYASRTLAVKHPEIYLQGDGIFAEVITTTPGLKQSYEIKDVHSQYFFKNRPQQLRGDSFSFEDVDFSKYKLVSSKEIYPPNYPFLPFFDRRLAPIATSLKTFDNKVIQLEKAEQLYFKAKQEGTDDLFLIYCDNENTYLYRDSALVQAKNQKETTNIEGNPILIFNEQYVWYPLMERDDTGNSEILTNLVMCYTTAKKEPELTDFERSLIDQLISVTELETEESMSFAKLISIIHAGSLFQMMPSEKQQELRSFEKLLFPHWRAWLKKTALLSPISAHLAEVVRKNEGRAGIEAMLNEYQKYTATSGYSFAHGHVWQCGMYEGGPEHCYRTHGGHCVVQSGNIGAALGLAGIDHYRMAGFAQKEFGLHHDYIYVPNYDLVISNAKIETVGSTVICPARRGGLYKYLTFIEHNGKWEDTRFAGRYWGTLSPEETLEIIITLSKNHNEDIQVAVISPGELNIMSFEELEQYLSEKQQSWSPLELPPFKPTGMPIHPPSSLLPTPTPLTIISTPSPMPVVTSTPSLTPKPSPLLTPKPPGFGAVSAIAGIFAVVYLLRRKKHKNCDKIRCHFSSSTKRG